MAKNNRNNQIVRFNDVLAGDANENYSPAELGARAQFLSSFGIEVVPNFPSIETDVPNIEEYRRLGVALVQGQSGWPYNNTAMNILARSAALVAHRRRILTAVLAKKDGLPAMVWYTRTPDGGVDLDSPSREDYYSPETNRLQSGLSLPPSSEKSQLWSAFCVEGRTPDENGEIQIWNRLVSASFVPSVGKLMFSSYTVEEITVETALGTRKVWERWNKRAPSGLRKAFTAENRWQIISGGTYYRCLPESVEKEINEGNLAELRIKAAGHDETARTLLAEYVDALLAENDSALVDTQKIRNNVFGAEMQLVVQLSLGRVWLINPPAYAVDFLYRGILSQELSLTQNIPSGVALKQVLEAEKAS